MDTGEFEAQLRREAYLDIKARTLGPAVSTSSHSHRFDIGTLGLAEAVASAPGPTCPLAQVQGAVERRKLAPVRFSPALDQALTRFTAEHAAAAPGSEGLLRTAGACAVGPASGLAQCLCEQVRPGSLPARYWFPEDHTSQVRERAARLGNDLAWLRPSADRLAHLDFWIHTTFALRDASTGASDESSTAALDFPPAQLAALRQHVADRLPRYLAERLHAPSYEDFMGPLEEFVLAQRLVRAAFAVQLGRDFPLPRLIELEKLTRRFVPSQPTIRWEPTGPAQDLFVTLTSADPQAGERYKAYQVDMMDRTRGGRPVCDRASN